MKKFLLPFFVLVFVCTNRAQSIIIDGNMFDWQPTMQLDITPNAEETTFEFGDDTDPTRGSDDPSYLTDLDIEDVYGTVDDDNVYFRIKMNSKANVLNIPNDTSYHGGGAITAYISMDPGIGDTTGLTWGWWGTGYDYMVQVFPPDSAYEANSDGYQQALWEHTQTSFGWDFEVKDTQIGSKVVWNSLNNDCEFSIPKSLLLNTKYLSQSSFNGDISVMIYAGENLGPWRADYASNPSISGFLLHVSTTDVKTEKINQPRGYILSQNYPNPFNPSTVINYSIPKSSEVKIKVFDQMGQEVSTIVNGYKTAGNYSVTFNAKNIPSGIYFYTLEAGSYKVTNKMILLK